MSPNKKNNKKVPLLNKKNSKENNNNPNENNEFYLTKKNRWFLLLIFTLIYILLMFNIGIFSSASSKIKLYLNIDNKKFGLFGSFNFIGRIFGTFLFMLIINKFNRKFILIIPLYLNSFCIFNFILTKNLIILYVFRTLNGICQNFGLIYFPMWIDQFGMKEKKTLMMTFIQLSAPIGMVFGYCFNTFFKSWKKGFLFESFGEIIFISILLFFPKKYFSKNLFFKGHFNSYFNINNNNNKQKISIFYNSNEIKNNNNLLKNIFSLLLNKMFLMTVLYKSTTQFICAGIGFWLTDYLENQLKTKNNLYKLYSYINIIVIGPMIGLFFGGIITNIIAAITAFVISPALFIKTVITFVILSTVDGYLINPIVYGKTNDVHPLIVIIALFAGGIIFGMFGIIISLPLAIIIISTIKYFKEDINDKIEDIKINKKIAKKTK